MRLLFAAGALALGFAPIATAQDALAPGFGPAGIRPLPAAYSAYATLSTGERVVFDGLTVDLYDADNVLLLNLATLPGFVFASFVALDPGESFAVVGESSNGHIYRVQLDGSGMSPLCTLPYNFDCTFADATTAYVSAAMCGVGCGNEIVRIDTMGGATALVASVPGASGPVAFDLQGRLLYATQDGSFPPPPASTDLVYWTPDQLQNGGLLGLGDATVLHAGLDGASSLAVDPVYGNILLAESVFMATSRVLELDADGDLVEVVVSSPEFLTKLELLPGGGPGHFHAFQPQDGVALTYGNGIDVKAVTPRRPRGLVVQNGSVIELRVTGALPNSSFLPLWGPQATYDPGETAYPLFDGFLFVTGIPLNQLRRGLDPVPVDSNGSGSFYLFDPGNLAGTLALQGLILDASGTEFLGTSTADLN